MKTLHKCDLGLGYKSVYLKVLMEQAGGRYDISICVPVAQLVEYDTSSVLAMYMIQEQTN